MDEVERLMTVARADAYRRGVEAGKKTERARAERLRGALQRLHDAIGNTLVTAGETNEQVLAELQAAILEARASLDREEPKGEWIGVPDKPFSDRGSELPARIPPESAESSEPWGHKMRLSIYVRGYETQEQVDAVIAAVNGAMPDADFVGMKIEAVQDEPKDQAESSEPCPTEAVRAPQPRPGHQGESMIEHGDFEALEGMYAYDTGSTDSGIHDPLRKAEILKRLRADSETRQKLARFLRDAFLSEEGIAQGYGAEDVADFWRWLEEQ